VAAAIVWAGVVLVVVSLCRAAGEGNAQTPQRLDNTQTKKAPSMNSRLTEAVSENLSLASDDPEITFGTERDRHGRSVRDRG
jgi:hypothetical protein